MKLKLRYSSQLARFFNVGAITLYPFIFIASKKEEVSLSLLKHEYSHVCDYRELAAKLRKKLWVLAYPVAWITFYAAYLYMHTYDRLLSKLTHDQAYRAIPTEMLARYAETQELSKQAKEEFECIL